MGRQRQGCAEVVEPSLAVSAAPLAPARPPAAALRPERRELQCRECRLLLRVTSVPESKTVRARHGFQCVLLCPGLSSPAPSRHPRAASDPTPSAEAERGTDSPAAPTNDSAVLHNKASHRSHWSCYFNQILADSPLKNLCLPPVIGAGSPDSSAESSEFENPALHRQPDTPFASAHSRPLASVHTVSHPGLSLVLFSGETWDFFQAA